MPVQLALSFQGGPPPTTSSEELPIDKSFPERAANELATLESYNKHLYRPNTYLHKWWARRSGTTFRYILKQLVLDPMKRNYYEPGGLEGKVILDPMVGGGTVLHEAIRMGANVLGVDIDPIPVLQTRAALTLSSLTHKEAVFKDFFEEMRKRLAPLYETSCPACEEEAEIQFVLYGLRRRCLCREALFVEDLILRKNNQHDIHICPRCHGVHSGTDHKCRAQADRPLMAKGVRHCQDCGGRFVDILEEPFLDRYVPLVAVGSCPKHRQFFKSMEEKDFSLINKARMQSINLNFGDSRKFQVHNGPKSDDLIRRRITSYQELFTPRQLLYIHNAKQLLSNLNGRERLWLALLVSTSLEFNSILCGYKGRDIRRPGAIRHVFSHHAYSFPYLALENNPVLLGNSSGTLRRLFNDRVVKAGTWAVAPSEVRVVNGQRRKVEVWGEVDGGEAVSNVKALTNGERRFWLIQKDSTTLDLPEGIVDYIVTDPPYHDNVQYSDLSNFFRVWLRILLPRVANWNYDPLASAVSEGCVAGGRKYGEVLGKIWKRCFRAINKEHGRLIFTFHHWRDEAWAELTLSLKRAGFALENRYVVFSENPISVHIRHLKAIKHDTVLVLRPGSSNKSFKWPKPSKVNTEDSYTFCSDCGAALGYFLDSQEDEESIRGEWGRLFTGDKGGKTSR